MAINRLSQGQVSNDHAENEQLDMNIRMANVEHDVIDIRELFIEDLSRRKEDKEKAKKRDDFLDKLLEEAEENSEIRKAVKKKLLSNGAWFGLVALGSGLWWILKETLKSHT